MPFAFKPGIPYYYQIKEDIRNKINEGILNPGDKIPTENDMVEEYGVSRPTIRQALSDLVQEGLLERTRGRGTFVAHSHITDNARVFTTFMGPGPWDSLVSQVIHSAIEVAPPYIIKELSLEAESLVVELTILLQRRNEKLAYRRFYIPAKLLPKISPQDFDSRPVFTVLQEEYGLIFNSAIQTFYAASANKEDTAILGLKPGSPVMVWEGVLYSTDTQPVSWVKTVFRGSSFHFTIVQGRDAPVPEGKQIGSGLMDNW